MNLLYPTFLWLWIPLFLLLYRKQKLATVVHLIILILLVFTLARPIQKEVMQKADIQAQDIIIALDISFSMRAKDLYPNRYTFAKETIDALLKKNPADNIMLIAFTSNPLLLSPPTTDHTLIRIALESLNPKYILTKGTSLRALFSYLKNMHKEDKQLILITDGGEEHDLDKVQTLLEESKLSLITLALGSNKGATIETTDGTMMKDKEGHLVISRLNPLLKSLSDSQGGSYITAAVTPQATANALDDALRLHHTQKQKIQKMQHHYKELYQFPLLLASLLFLLLHTHGMKYLLILFGLFGIQLHATFLDDYHLTMAYSYYKQKAFNQTEQELKKITLPSLQSQMTLANTYYKQGLYKKAIHTYKSIRTTSTSIKQQIYYNIANACVMQKAYNKAKVYYTKALQLGKDTDALYNLKHILFLHDKKDGDLGIAHPKSQNNDASKSDTPEEKKKRKQDEDAPSSGSGGGGEKSKNKKPKKGRLKLDIKAKPQPLGSKAYDLINKGYIHETHPW